MSDKLRKLLTEADAKKKGLTVRVTRPEPLKYAQEAFEPVLANFHGALRKAAIVQIKGGLAEVWAEKAPKLKHVTCLDYGDLGVGPPSQWSKNGRPKPLRECP